MTGLGNVLQKNMVLLAVCCIFLAVGPIPFVVYFFIFLFPDWILGFVVNTYNPIFFVSIVCAISSIVLSLDLIDKKGSKYYLINYGCHFITDSFVRLVLDLPFL